MANFTKFFRNGKTFSAYIHSGAGLQNYYEDRDAGYAY